MQGDPRDLYAALRREYGNVVPVELMGGVPAWLVIGYKEALTVLRTEAGRAEYGFTRDLSQWIERRQGRIPENWPLDPHTTVQPNALFATGLEHERLRGALSRALKRPTTMHVRRETTGTARRLIAQFKDGQADLISQYAAPLPVLVLSKLMGFTPEEGQHLQGEISALLESGERAVEASRRITQMIEEKVEDRRSDPRGDMVSSLIVDSAELNNAEVVATLWLVLNAGQPATSGWLAHALAELLTPEMLSAMYAGHTSIPGVMERTLWELPPVENIFGRVARGNPLLGEGQGAPGVRIPDGDLVVIGVGGANLDPCLSSSNHPRSSYTDSSRAHLSFGAGNHECPVPELAEAIVESALGTLWEELSAIAPTDPERVRESGDSPIVRELTALHVTFRARTPDSGGN